MAKKYGTITVFNVFSQDLVLSLNGGLAQGTGAIPGWTLSSGPLKYQPQGLAVDRVLNQSDGLGQFWGPSENQPGVNGLNLNWGDGAYLASVSITKSTNADMLLFIYRNKWDLVNVDDGTVAIGGDVTSHAAIQAAIAAGKK
jgi:hypothetical protein